MFSTTTWQGVIKTAAQKYVWWPLYFKNSFLALRYSLLLLFMYFWLDWQAAFTNTFTRISSICMEVALWLQARVKRWCWESDYCYDTHKQLISTSSTSNPLLWYKRTIPIIWVSCPISWQTIIIRVSYQQYYYDTNYNAVLYYTNVASDKYFLTVGLFRAYVHTSNM